MESYKELTNMIDVYMKTGNYHILVSIQGLTETYREELVKDMTNFHPEYFKIFLPHEQVKIVSDLIKRQKQEEHLAEHFAYCVSWMLPYVSSVALNDILSDADSIAIGQIMIQIQRHIRVIGNRFCDSPAYPWLHTTNVISRMCERIMWRKLYKKCKHKLES